MNKRIASLLLCFVMVFALMAITTPAFADTSAHPPVTFTIKPDKTTAKPGDTITYQAIIGPVEKLQTAQFKLVIPEELDYTGGSSPEGLTEKLNAASAEFTSSTMKFVLGGIKVQKRIVCIEEDAIIFCHLSFPSLSCFEPPAALSGRGWGAV